MKSITVKLFSIKKLKKHFDRKIFAVPQLQREFVWNTRKACDLLDSIYNNYPIGTILIWDSHKNSLTEFRQDYISLPLFDNIHNQRIYLIIDGQQRLSVLYHCFIGDQIENSFYKEVDFGKIYFNLNHKNNSNSDKNFSRFRFTKHPDSQFEVNVSDLLSSSWASKFRAYPKFKKNEIKKCREKLLNYEIPLIFIDTKDLSEIEKSFIRINSAGTPLSSADRAITLATSIDLRHNINGIRNQLKHGFKKIGRLNLLMTISLIWGNKQVGRKGIESVLTKIKYDEDEQEKFKKIWLILRNSYTLASDYLVHHLGVVNFDYLPSQNMLTILSAFFYYNDKQPSPFQKEQIKRWFWYTGVGSRYSGRGYSKNIVDDFEFFKKLGEGKYVKFKLTEKISLNDIKTADYSKKGSLSNAYFCLLASNKPRYLQGGGDIPLNEISSRSNKKNKHHIFPRQHLINKGFNKKYYNSIANICFLVWKENIEFGFKAPRVYLEDYKHKKYFPGVMRSHFIPHKKVDGLWDTDSKKGFKKFLDIRAKVICKRFEKVAGVKMFEKF